jgi:hypothetical protein
MSDQFIVGNITTIVVPDPAAGAEFTYLLPAGRRYKILSIAFTFTSSAGVATRQVSIYVSRTALAVYASVAQATQVASKIYQYFFAPLNRDMAAAINDIVTVPLSNPLVLLPGDSLISYTPLKVAGDQYSDISMQVESFLLP